MEVFEKVKNMEVEERVLATLAYFEIFDLALNINELRRLLPGEMLIGNEITEIVKRMEEVGSIVSLNGWCALKKGKGLLEKRNDKDALAEVLLRKINKWKWIFSIVPFVEFAGVCNYLSFKSVEKDSDIDLLIVTKPGRIFLAKVFLTLYMHLLGIRRHGNKVAQRFCLSFYVNADNLNFKEILLKDDVYFAYWLLALKPLYDSKNVWEKIEQENEWINSFLVDFRQRRESTEGIIRKKSWWKRFNEWLLVGKFGDFLENNLREYFVKRNKQKKLPETSSVVVSEEMLKFHNHDKRAEFRDEWFSKLDKLSIKLP